MKVNKYEIEFYMVTSPVVYDETDFKKLLLYLDGKVEVIHKDESIYKGDLETAVIIYNSIIS